MKLKKFSLGPLGTNCYIVIYGQAALIIDPGGEAHRVINYLTEYKLEPVAILLTHAHFDHIGAVNTVRTHYNIEVYGHRAEARWLNDGQLNGSLLFMGAEMVTAEPEKLLISGSMKINCFSFDVIHTPGHSPGSLSFVFHDDDFIIGGDTLFNGGVGRTDLSGGDFSQLKRSIQTKLYTLPDYYKVYPGHGPITEIGHEKQNNPFVRGSN